MDRDVVDNEVLNHLAMNFLAHSSSEAETCSAYSEEVAYSGAVAYSEAVVYSPCEVMGHPSFEVVDHNCRMMEIFPRV